MGGVHYFPLQRGADIHNAVDGRTNLGISQHYLRLLFLSAGRRQLAAIGQQLALAHRDLFGVGTRQGQGRLLRIDLPTKRLDMSLRRIIGGPILVIDLGRNDSSFIKVLGPFIIHARSLQSRRCFDLLRLGGSQRGFRLTNLLGGL